jgi:Domain of unknown function (DUF4386)
LWLSGERRTLLNIESGSLLLRRITGALFLIGALSFATAATLLSATFDWPDILREPADVVLTRFAEGGPSLVWTWFATAWTYAILMVPILLLPIALGRRDDAALWVASFAGAVSVVLALIGFLGFPVFDLAGLIGSTGWGLWIAALGVTLLVRLKAKEV